MHKKQEEILRTRIHNLEKVIARQEDLLRRSFSVCLCFDIDDPQLCLRILSLGNDILKELDNDFC